MLKRSIPVLVLVGLLLMPAAAPAQVCEPDPPKPRLTRAERELRDAISTRKTFGLPHGRAYVRRVNADAAARRRATMWYGSMALTEREAAYFRLRDRIERGAETVAGYVRRHRDTYSGLSIEDDYPRSPYLLVRFTRDLAKHRRAIARRYSLRLVVRRSRYTYRELLAITDRIDSDELVPEGIHPLGWGPHGDRVELEVATRRADAAAVVRRLYGPAVVVKVVAADPTYLACNSPETYRLDPDGRTLHVAYVDSGSVVPRHVEVVEGADEVRVGIVTEVPHGFVTLDAVTYTLSVTLAAPLGDRAVRSTRTGRRVRRQDDGL